MITNCTNHDILVYLHQSGVRILDIVKPPMNTICTLLCRYIDSSALQIKVNGVYRCIHTCDSTDEISDNMAGIEKNPIGTMTEMSETPMES